MIAMERETPGEIEGRKASTSNLLIFITCLNEINRAATMHELFCVANT